MVGLSGMGPASLPDRVDLREYLWPVEDVGDVPAAAAAAVTAALEYHCNRLGERPTNLSTSFVHFNARRLGGTHDRNGGTTMDAVMKAVATFGACREETWPSIPGTVTQAPPAAAYAEARKFAAVRAAHPVNPLESLALNYPTPVVVRVPMRCLTDAGRTGTLPAPTAEEQRRTDHPVHALLLVGYDQGAKTYLARNCWGERWGDRGQCRIPFDVLHGLAPVGSTAYWLLAPADASATDAIGPVAAPGGVAPLAASGAETMASMAARMRAELRGELHRDLADAAKQMRDRVTPPGSASGSVQTCSSCSGTRLCPVCGGPGCSSCAGAGWCTACR